MESSIDRITREFVGKRFGRLVINDIKDHPGGPCKYIANCLCDCGEVFDIRLSNIRYKGRISCGCEVDTDIGELVGTKVGLLTVTRHFKRECQNGKVIELVLCECDCGRELGALLEVKYFGVGEHDRCSSCIQGRRISAGLQKVRVEDWIGYKVSPVKKARSDKANQKWRRAVLKRDNYTCQCCGVKEHLEVHHIENFSKKKGKRFDENNGITLCYRCHSMYAEGSFHRIYGTHNNNAAQLAEYLANDKNRQSRLLEGDSCAYGKRKKRKVKKCQKTLA